MSNYISRILGGSKSSLEAQQAIIATTSNNIANVNTPGYARRRVELSTRRGSDLGGLSVGSGVETTRLTRLANEYLDDQVQDSTGKFHAAQTEDNFLKRAEDLFSFESSVLTIGSAVNEFFHSMNDLSENPANIELRSVFVQKGEELASAIQSTYNGIANLQAEADSQLVTEVATLNSITTEIAGLNEVISQRESDGRTVAADERDQREVLLRKLSEKISFIRTDVSDGSVTLTLNNGFVLVSADNANQLDTKKFPSFTAPPGAATPSLDGGALNFITFDYAVAPPSSDADLTGALASGEGSIAGLLKVRGVVDSTVANPTAFDVSGVLVDLAARVEDVTLSLAVEMNERYLGPDADTGTAGHQPSARDLDGNPPSIFGLFDGSAGISDLGNTLPDTADINAYLAANGLTALSSDITFAISDPRRVAAARIDSGGVFQGVGDSSNFSDLTNGVAALQEVNLTGAQTGTSGNFQELNDQLVSTIGNARNSSRVRADVADFNLTVANNNREDFSGVSLDEEFTNLITFQKAYEASARMIRVAEEMLDELLQLF